MRRCSYIAGGILEEVKNAYFVLLALKIIIDLREKQRYHTMPEILHILLNSPKRHLSARWFSLL